MAKGDGVGDVSSVATGATKIIRPASGIEWIIHNVYYEGATNSYITDNGTDTLLFASSGGKGSMSAYFWHLRIDHYLKIKNTESTSKLIGFDGIVSKE